MHEITKKRRWNADAVSILSQKRGISTEYIRQVLRGDKKGVKPDEIKKEYKQIDRALNKTVSKILKTN
ncbi:MAG TPA: hypothetical protein PLP27_05545 [Crocinitomicaceae bacterium]|nr:hypothetical protein [Crocinitomicaceae bacterium]